MDKSVMMLVGKWKCLEGGMWRFRMSDRYFAKCVDVEDEDKFAEVEDKIAKVYGIDKKKTKMELSFWYEGGDAVFTQQKMPPVSVDSESSLTKFKNIRLEKGGMNMYVSVDQDEDDLPDRGGQSELSAFDENMLRAVAIAETGHRGSFQAMGGQDLGSHCLPYTYEEVDFLAEVDEIEQVYRAINVKRGRGADYLEEVGANSGETLVSCEISEDYDFDKMRDRIDREYPADWDPYNPKRTKSWSAAGDAEVRGEDEDISGDNRTTSQGTSAAIVGENIRVSPIARIRACDYREVEEWGPDDAVMFSYEQLAQSLQNTEVGETNGAEMDSEGGRGTGAEDGPDTDVLLSIELGQRVMSPVRIYSACETITQQNTDGESERQVSPGLRRSVGDAPDGSVADADDGSGSSRRPTQMSDYGVTSLVSPIINSTEGSLADAERCTNEQQPRRCCRLSLRGRNNVAAEDVGNVRSGGPEVVDESHLENRSMSPIGYNIGADNGNSTGPEEGALALMAIVNQVPEDDPIFLGDPTPFKDNAVAVTGDKANMNLRKSEDCMYIGRVFKNKNELHKALCIYSIKRREKAKKALTRCTPEIEQLLIDHLKEATDCVVIASTEWIYQVNDGYGTVFTVDLRKKTCTCRVFDVLMVPCCHALAAVGIRNLDIYSLIGKYAFVSEWRKLWTEHILPPPKERDTEVPVDISQVDVNAPKTKRPSGRPRTVRIPSQGEHHLPKHLRVSIVLLVGKSCYRHLGPLILSGNAGLGLALDPSVLRETSLALLEAHPQNISIGSPIHLFVLRCVKARNPVACYLESIRLAAVEGLIKEAMDMLADIPDPSPKILFTKGLYLVSVNRPLDAMTAMNQFKHEVVSSRNANRVATLVMSDIKKIAPDQLRFNWTGYTCYLIHPPRRYSECSKCNLWNPCPLCVNWWVL
ncbi:unnamed protein product [Arabidopsis arenosa]|uniref:SWIM-type domain-containing protein n=1 Tax=Arabidopsis arenosa TaxID=38785 RepID=A0A8S2A9V5_ARAAE|nr:unnamed protein product [Arabidopsis arenosa]